MPLNHTKNQVCKAIIKSLEEKEVDAVMSNELMATIRNADFIPLSKRYSYIEQINGLTVNEKTAHKVLVDIEMELQCGYKPKRYEVDAVTDDEEYARYMRIISQNKNDPRVRGNR